MTHMCETTYGHLCVPDHQGSGTAFEAVMAICGHWLCRGAHMHHNMLHPNSPCLTCHDINRLQIYAIMTTSKA